MKLVFSVIAVALLAVVSVYGYSNWNKFGSFFTKNGYKNVALVDLLSFAAVYDGQSLCTKGYVIEGPGASFIKTETTTDKLEGSAWLVNETSKSYIFNTSGTVTKAEMARVCGSFVSKRDGEFGNPPLWRHQLTINEFTSLGDPFAVNY